MNIEKDLQKDGIIITEKVNTDTILNITNSIANKIAQSFPNFGLKKEEIFAKLFTLSMYRADMPEGMAEANYCYKNSSIYFNSHIADEDLEEFAIHECLHFLQEVKDEKNKIQKMGLSTYSKFKIIGMGINEAAVQYISSKIIGIEADFEKYYDISLRTPSPSYYPLECALLNELVYFIGEDTLFKSTYFSCDDFKNEIIKRTSKAVYESIVSAFDDILKYEEKLIILNNKLLNTEKSSKLQLKILKYREKINNIFMQTQNLIIQDFFDFEFNNISNLEQLENFRKRLINFENLIGKTDGYIFYDNYCTESMNKLEHKSNILENGGTETALINKHLPVLNIFDKLKKFFSMNFKENP